MRAPGKLASVFLGGLLTIILVLGFTLGWVDILQGYETANKPMAEAKITVSTEQISRSQEIAGFCDGCHSPASRLPLGSKAVSFSGDAAVVFLPLEVFRNGKGGDPQEIVAYSQAPGPDLQVVGLNWSETDFIKTLREGITPQGHALGRGMPWRDIAAVATDDDLRSYYVYLQRENPIDK